MKSAEEIMEALEAHDLTGSFRDAGELAGCSHQPVKRRALPRSGNDGGSVGRGGAADRSVPGQGRAVARDVEAQGPRGRRAPAAARPRLHRPGADHPAGGRVGQARPTARPGPGAPAVGDRAGVVAAARLRRWPGHRRSPDDPVLRVGGLVAVPGGPTAVTATAANERRCIAKRRSDRPRREAPPSVDEDQEAEQHTP